MRYIKSNILTAEFPTQNTYWWEVSSRLTMKIYFAAGQYIFFPANLIHIMSRIYRSNNWILFVQLFSDFFYLNKCFFRQNVLLILYLQYETENRPWLHCILVKWAFTPVYSNSVWKILHYSRAQQECLCWRRLEASIWPWHQCKISKNSSATFSYFLSQSWCTIAHLYQKQKHNTWVRCLHEPISLNEYCSFLRFSSIVDKIITSILVWNNTYIPKNMVTLYFSLAALKTPLLTLGSF